MQTSTKATLLSLCDKLDADRAVFCTQALTRETESPEFPDVFARFLAAFGRLSVRQLEGVGTPLQDALSSLVASLGADKYVDAIASQNVATAHLAVLLAPLRRSADLSADPAGLRLSVANMPGLDEESIAWITRSEIESPVLRPAVIKLFLRRYAESSETGEGAVADLGEALLAHPTGAESLRAVLRTPGNPAIAGALLLLGKTADAKHVELIGPFLQDFGAWERLSRAILTPARLEAILEHAHGTRVSTVLRETSPGDPPRERAASLAQDADFHRSVARFISTASPLSLASSLLDSEVGASLKGFVSDVGAPIRLAAAKSLSHIHDDAIVTFMRAGLVDRNKDVRSACQTWLEGYLGTERYADLLREMGEETRSIQQRLSGLGEWARRELAEMEGKMGAAATAVMGGLSSAATKARSLFDTKEKSANE